MAEAIAFASLIVGISAVAALLAARTREVRASARIEDLEVRVARIAALVGLPADAIDVRRAGPALPKPSPESIALFAAGRKIDAIRVYRAESGADLSEAKASLEMAAREAAAGGASSTSDRTASPDGRSLIL
jgi:hypothetical protein